MIVYPANESGQPIDDKGNVVQCEYSLYNGLEVYVFESYEEWERYVYQLNLAMNDSAKVDENG